MEYNCVSVVVMMPRINLVIVQRVGVVMCSYISNYIFGAAGAVTEC